MEAWLAETNMAIAPLHLSRPLAADTYLAIVKFVGTGQEEAIVTWVLHADFGIPFWSLHLDTPTDLPWGLEHTTITAKIQ